MPEEVRHGWLVEIICPLYKMEIGLLEMRVEYYLKWEKNEIVLAEYTKAAVSRAE
jgi:hypothetical protein